MKHNLFGNPVETSVAANPLGRRAHLTFRGNVSAGRHGWLRLTPAYSLHVVRKLLEGSSGQRVLDPFSGTATTPLASALMGIACDAVDINPFLVWLGNLKVGRFAPGTADAVRKEAGEIASRLAGFSGDTQCWAPAIHTIERWWPPDILRALSRLFQEISEVEQGDSLGDLLKVSFCRVMIQNANITFGHQSMSFRTPKPAIVPALAFSEKPGAASRVSQEFLAVAHEIANSVETDRPLADSTIYAGDSRNLAQVVPFWRYTKVITSPPYPNRMSYIRELRPYMYWLGFLTTGRQAGEMDWQAIGGTWGTATSSLGAWQASKSLEVPYEEFSGIVNAIHQKHPILAKYVHRYFEDITRHILSLRQMLATGATCHYIVGNSKFYETMVPVERIFASIFQLAGFSGVHIETLRKRTSKKELFEYIVHAELR